MYTDKMSKKERWASALYGKPVDRIPIWLMCKFDLRQDYTDSFAQSWRMDKGYRKLVADNFELVDDIYNIDIYPFNRFLLTPEKYIETKDEIQKDYNTRERITIIHTPKGDLYNIDQIKRNINTIWTVKYPAKNIDDLRKLASVPFEIDYTAIEKYYEAFKKRHNDLGDNGILKIFLSSPIVCISGSMQFDDFLELTLIEKDYIHELLGMITDRYLQVLAAIFDKYDYDAVFWFGGSEQCTPPMMNPLSFDEFVVPYDKKLVDFLKNRGKFVGCHCHGKVKHALSRMIDIGYEATDPVEPPSQGNLNLNEAFEIVNNKMTLLGNFEFVEFEQQQPDYIIKRTLEILKNADKRMILSSGGGFQSPPSDHLINNYHAVFNTYRDFYGMEKIST